MLGPGPSYPEQMELMNQAAALVEQWKQGEKAAAGKLMSLLGAMNIKPAEKPTPVATMPVLEWVGSMADFRHLLGHGTS